MKNKIKKCPVCDWEIKESGMTVKIRGRTVVVCCDECAEAVKAQPQKYLPVEN